MRSVDTPGIPDALPPERETFVDTGNNHTLIRYFMQVSREFKFANNFGLALDDDDRGIKGRPAYLNTLFVPPHLVSRHYLPEQLIEAEHTPEAREWKTPSPVLAEHPRWFILGDPGSGKTTLIQWLMLNFTSSGDTQPKNMMGPLVPFALILRELDLSGANDWEDIWQIFLAQGGELTESLRSDPKTIEQVLESGQGLFLIDGLDEITEPKTRATLGQAVLRAMHQYPRCRFIITSRLVGFSQQEWFGQTIDNVDYDNTEQAEFDAQDVSLRQAGSWQGLPVDYLAPFDQRQVQSFSHHWFRHYIEDEKDRLAQSVALGKSLHAHKDLDRLARIPMLLNMICFIYIRRGGRLPDGRAELYESIAETYLTSLDRARGVKFHGREMNFDYLDLSEWLGELALRMQERRTANNSAILLPETEVRDFLHGKLIDRGFEQVQANEEAIFILGYLSQRSGLLIPRGKVNDEEYYAFAHLSFLEYFAANELKIQATLWPAKDWAALREKARQSWWGETIVLLFEQLDNSRLVTQMLRQFVG
ncbi:MAG: NACHT domain-containing protein, partial [Pseudomonadota bacterium]